MKELKIFKNNYNLSVILTIIMVSVLLQNNNMIHPLLKYFFILVSLFMSFYFNPYAIILNITNKDYSNSYKTLAVISCILISIITAYLIILMFTTKENVLNFGKIIIIINFIYSIILYFFEKPNKKLLITHLILIFTFSTLIQFL